MDSKVAQLIQFDITPSGIPLDLNLAPSVKELIRIDISPCDYDKIKKNRLVDHYSKVKRELNKTPPPTPPLVVATLPENPPKPDTLSRPPPIATATVVTAGLTSGPKYSYETGAVLVRASQVNSAPIDDISRSTLGTSTLEFQKRDSTPVVKPIAATNNAVADGLLHQQKIQRMVQIVNSSPESCEFYLESTNWNVDDAVSMYYQYTPDLNRPSSIPSVEESSRSSAYDISTSDAIPVNRDSTYSIPRASLDPYGTKSTVIAQPAGAFDSVAVAPRAQIIASANPINEYQQKIQRMSKQVKAPVESCEFFLESANWNVDDAIAMYYQYTPDAANDENPNPQPPIQATTAPANKRKQLIEQLEKEIHESVETCEFYLDCVNGDVQEAIKIYRQDHNISKPVEPPVSNDRQLKIDRMVTELKAPAETCAFYLECVGGNVEDAILMYRQNAGTAR